MPVNCGTKKKKEKEKEGLLPVWDEVGYKLLSEGRAQVRVSCFI